MDITLTQKSIEDRVLRVWLKRIPVDSNVVFAFRLDCDEVDGDPVSEAYVYGRGAESNAEQRILLLFRLEQSKDSRPFEVGEVLRLMIRSLDSEGFEPLELDLLAVE